MTALTDNQIVESQVAPQRLKKKVVNGTIRIYKGALLAYEGGNIGYVKLAADNATDEFAGIALEEKNLALADNATDGTFDVLVIPRGSGEYVKLNVSSTITIANEGDPVYMDDDGAVDIASGIVNSTTLGLVGIIREFVSANSARVQLTQMASN